MADESGGQLGGLPGMVYTCSLPLGAVFPHPSNGAGTDSTWVVPQLATNGGGLLTRKWGYKATRGSSNAAVYSCTLSSGIVREGAGPYLLPCRGRYV